MVTITILGFDYALGAAIFTMNDLLYFSGNLLYPQQNPGSEPQFKLRLASLNGKPIKTLNQLTIPTHCAIEDIEHSDVWLVPTISGDIERTLHQNPHITEQLIQANQSDSLIGSNSSGSFFLAEAGLLNGKTATTLGSAETLFRQRYPAVDLQMNQRFIHDENILTDCGGMAWFDMGLYLVELFCGHAIASQAAGYFIVDSQRSAQLSFAPTSSRKQHQDQTILDIQNWMEEKLGSHISQDHITRLFNISERSLIRRFKRATGETPNQYLQNLRLDAASKLLLHTSKSIDTITLSVGYLDVSSFTRLFKRRTGMSPGIYRVRFKAIA